VKTDPGETVEALYQSQGQDRHGIYWVILGGAAAAFAAIFFVRADVTVLARGAIRPELERVQIVAPIDGHIVELNVVENAAVKEGALLLRLKSDTVDELLRFNERENRENAGAVADLQYLLQCCRDKQEVDASRLQISSYRADW
jgi:multidrug efflux pump subunit AcrA (membrane-fusion protein)